LIYDREIRFVIIPVTVQSLVQNYSRSYPRHTREMSLGDISEVSHSDTFPPLA
jgi:hypothetical protein